MAQSPRPEAKQTPAELNISPSIKPKAIESTVPLTQDNLQATEIVGFDDLGRKLTFQIRGAEVDPKDPEKEIYLYTVFYKDNNQQWQNLCKGDATYPARAIVLQGSWDSTGAYNANDQLVTFSCANGALGKCVRFGYKPWKTEQGKSLRDYHQACVRMVRADYCGDGVGHTKNGTPINLYDFAGIQKSDPAPNMQFEAAWSGNGAQCINHVRWPEGLDYVKRVCPQRLAVPGAKNQCATAQQARQNFPQALLFNDSIVRTR
ncbi:MAG TPA: ADYC domain-containing protein [Nostocaceae cyanobacterium]|nr:ADYC domain-containing protein [Nostocaceae cyanobacterium]